jgi:endonuclease III
MPEILEQYFGKSSEDSPLGDWIELVKIVLLYGRSTSSDDRDWTWLLRSDLPTASDAASAGSAVWETALESAGFTPNKAGLLVRLARWWHDEIGDNEPSVVLARKALSDWQTQLRSIRGVSWELADLILLTLGAGPVYPLDRGSRRIVLRHGWLDLTAEYVEWQSFFSRGARDGRVDLRWLWKRTSDVGRKFCGSQPKCEECPLRGILPERGPVQFDGDA